MRRDIPMREYMLAADHQLLSMISIEHVNAVKRIDEIVEAKGSRCRAHRARRPRFGSRSSGFI